MNECSGCKHFRSYPGGYSECSALNGSQLSFGKKHERCPGYEVPHSCETCSKFWYESYMAKLVDKDTGEEFESKRYRAGCKEEHECPGYSKDCPYWEGEE